MKIVYLLSVVILTGCSYTPKPVIVYGGSSKQYIAPDLCAAIVKCKNSTEKECYYNSSVYVLADGQTKEAESCKAAK